MYRIKPYPGHLVFKEKDQTIGHGPETEDVTEKDHGQETDQVEIGQEMAEEIGQEQGVIEEITREIETDHTLEIEAEIAIAIEERMTEIEEEIDLETVVLPVEITMEDQTEMTIERVTTKRIEEVEIKGKIRL